MIRVAMYTNNGRALGRVVARTRLLRHFSHQSKTAQNVEQQVGRYQVGIPIEEAHSPPSSWYRDQDMFALEQEAVFSSNWVAVDVLASTLPGSFQTGTFGGQPYLLTCNPHGQLQAFYNVCTHMASCLVGPWTTGTASCSTTRLKSSLVGQSTQGRLSVNRQQQQQQHAVFQCPYHGWQFNLDGRLTKAVHVKGIQNFSPRNYNLKSIPVQQLGPIVFLNFGSPADATDTEELEHSNTKLMNRFQQNGFATHPDLANLRLIKTNTYTVNCNWKVFMDNYGDGCKLTLGSFRGEGVALANRYKYMDSYSALCILFLRLPLFLGPRRFGFQH
jgi:choline monooxygenase